MSTFVYHDNRFQRCDFTDVTVRELIEGPYCIKFESPDFSVPIYYVGHDNKMRCHILAKGKLAVPIKCIIDAMRGFAFWADADPREPIGDVTYGNLMEALSKSSNHLQQTSVFRDLEKSS